MDSPASRGSYRLWTILAFATPPVCIALLVVIYLISPEFYLRRVLAYRVRETQAVEIITVIQSLLAAGLLLYCGVRYLRLQRSQPGASRLPGGAFFILLIGLAALFFAGEEASWGQTYLGWKTPEKYAKVSGETNLHNAKLPISIHSLGTIFIWAMLVVLPIAWAMRKRWKLPLPEDWAPAIAGWPVAACVVLAEVWQGYKDIYRVIYTKDEQSASAFYVEFLEQINEQKEWLIAWALLFYAIERYARLRRERKREA
jgi:hypothetical protein